MLFCLGPTKSVGTANPSYFIRCSIIQYRSRCFIFIINFFFQWEYFRISMPVPRCLSSKPYACLNMRCIGFALLQCTIINTMFLCLARPLLKKIRFINLFKLLIYVLMLSGLIQNITRNPENSEKKEKNYQAVLYVMCSKHKSGYMFIL